MCDSLHCFSTINSFLDYLHSTTVLTTVPFFCTGLNKQVTDDHVIELSFVHGLSKSSVVKYVIYKNLVLPLCDIISCPLLINCFKNSCQLTPHDHTLQATGVLMNPISDSSSPKEKNYGPILGLMMTSCHTRLQPSQEREGIETSAGCGRSSWRDRCSKWFAPFYSTQIFSAPISCTNAQWHCLHWL